MNRSIPLNTRTYPPPPLLFLSPDLFSLMAIDGKYHFIEIDHNTFLIDVNNNIEGGNMDETTIFKIK